MRSLFQHNYSIFLLLFIAGFLLYSVVIPGNFLFDDNLFIENNGQIKSLDNIPDLYLSSVTEGSSVARDNFYRPNQQLVNSVLYFFFGLDPRPFHISSILLHVVNAFLIFLLFTRLGLERRISFISSLLFTIHPINTQAISYISGMADPLALAFVLLALLSFLKSFNKNQTGAIIYSVCSICFFSLGLLSKEIAIVFPALALLTALFFS